MKLSKVASESVIAGVIPINVEMRFTLYGQRLIIFGAMDMPDFYFTMTEPEYTREAFVYTPIDDFIDAYVDYDDFPSKRKINVTGESVMRTNVVNGVKRKACHFTVKSWEWVEVVMASNCAEIRESLGRKRCLDPSCERCWGKS